MPLAGDFFTWALLLPLIESSEEDTLAEAVVVVCDGCGVPAVDTVSIRAGGKTLQKDLCERHLKELLTNARPARRGRPRTKASSPSRATRAKSGATRKKTARKTARKTAKKKRAA